MSEVGDIEELLAALAQEDARAVSHGVAQPHHDLSHISVLPDDINFSLQAHSTMGLTGESHLGNSQIPHCVAGGTTHSDILSQNISIIDEVISNPTQANDASSMQPGSSLGSLFLDSVDEILSHEKTTHLQFASPQTQAPTQRQKPKAKKPVQQKATIDSSPLAGNQLLPQSGTSFSPGSRTPAAGLPPVTSAHAFIDRNSVLVTQPSEAFVRRQAQNIQLTRPHSNASDSSFYPGSVPQPSPVGSVDSSINPRTPVSNNPLTPQSMQPPTPQPNLALGTPVSLSSSGTSLPQMQQHPALMSESDYLSGNPLRSPPVPDDQSHLQYLNTGTSTNTQSNLQLSGAKSGVGFQQIAFLQGQQVSMSENYPGANSYIVRSAESVNSISQVNWQQNLQLLSTPSTTQNQAFLVPSHSAASSLQNVFVDMHQNFSSKSLVASNTQGVLYSNAGDIGAKILNQTDNFGVSEGLTYNQSQLLDNLTGRGKSKTTAVEAIEKNVSSISRQSVGSNQQLSMQNFQAEKPDTRQEINKSFVAQRTQKSSSVSNMLQTAESGIKQIFSQSIAYEAISPASDHSPSKNLLSKPDSNNSSMLRHHDNTSVSSSSSRVDLSNVESDERSLVGPLARRRSASKEQKQIQASKATDSAAFDFEDEFGLDQNEPTIRLPSKRAEATDITVTKSAANEQSTPILTQTIQRENYSDPSVYDSVQELAVLQQKQRSLMEALNASRSKSQQKPSRYTQKSSSVSAKSTSNKPSKRRTSKTDFSKDNISKLQTPVGQERINQTDMQKGVDVESAKRDDIFFEQFLTPVSTKTVTTATLTSHFSKSVTSSGVVIVSSSAAVENQSSVSKLSNPTLPACIHTTTINLQTRTLPAHTLLTSKNLEAHTPPSAHVLHTSKDLQSHNPSMHVLPTRTDLRTHTPPSHIQPPVKNLQTHALRVHQPSTESLPTSFDLVQNLKTNSPRVGAFQSSAAAYTNSTVGSTALPSFSSLYTTMGTSTLRAKATAITVTTAIGNFATVSTSVQAATVTSSKNRKANTAVFENTTLNQRQNTTTLQSSVPDILSYFNQHSNVPSSHQLYSKGTHAQQDLRKTLESMPPSCTPMATESTLHTKTGFSSTGKTDPKVVDSRSQFSTDLFQSMLLQQSASISQSPNKSSVSSTTQSVFASSITSHSTVQSRLGVPAPVTNFQNKQSVSQTQLNTRSHSTTVVSATKATESLQARHLPWHPLPEAVTSSAFATEVAPKLSDQSLAKERTSHASSLLKTTAASVPTYGSSTNLSTNSMFYPPVSNVHAYGYSTQDAFTNYINRQMSLNDPAAKQKSLELLRYAQEHENYTPQQPLHPHVAASTTLGFFPSNTTGAPSAVTSLPVFTSTLTTLSSSQHQSEIQRVSQSWTSTSSIDSIQKNLPGLSVSSGLALTQTVLTQKTACSTSSSGDSMVTRTNKDVTNATAAVDFSVKTAVTTSSITISPVKLTPKTFEPIFSSPVVNKDKTFHGPKKKHILEKYTQQTQKPTGPISVVRPDVSIKPSEFKPPEINKLRRPSFETNSKLQTKSTQPLRTYGSLAKTSASTSVTESGETVTVAESKTTVQKTDSKAKKNEKSGSIFSLFDSLLQEATESAKDSLKSEPAKRKETNKFGKDSTKDSTKIALRKSDSGDKKAPEPTRRGTRASTKANTKASAKAAASAKTSSLSAKSTPDLSAKVAASHAKAALVSSTRAASAASTRAASAASAKAVSTAGAKAVSTASAKAISTASVKAVSTASAKAVSAASTKGISAARTKVAFASNERELAVSKKAVSTTNAKVSSAIGKSADVAGANVTFAGTKTTPAVTTSVSVLEKAASDTSTKTISDLSAKVSSARTIANSVSRTSTASSSIKTNTDAVEAQATTANRNPATFPFKRRHFQNQSKMSTNTTISATPITTTRTNISSERIINSMSKAAAITTSTQALRAIASKGISAPQSALPAAIPKQSIPKSTSSEVVPPSSGLRLRITAFHSSSGQVIHQTTLMGDLVDAEDYSSEDSEYRRKKKRKKRRKRRKRLAAELAELNKLLLPLQFKPPSKPSSSSDNDDHAFIAPARDDVSSPQMSDASESEPNKTGAKKRKTTKTTPVKILTSNSPSLDSDSDKRKLSMKSKKTSMKVVQRYKLKSSQTSSQESVLSSLSFSRQPGKPPLYLNAGANQTMVSGSSQGIPTIQLVPRTCSKPPVKISSLSSISTLHSAIKLSGTNASAKPIQPLVVPKTTSSGVRYVLQTSNSVGSSFSPRVIIPKITPTTFSVGKATVFTVSSSGARVFGTPKIQIQPTPTQTSTQNSTILSPTKPVIMKRVPVSLLSKISIPSVPIVKISESSTTVTSSINVPCVVSFTSKPVKSSSKILAPKPVLATSLPSAFEKSLAEINAPQLVIPTIAEAPDQNGKLQEKTKDEAEFQSAFSKLISSPNPLEKYSPPPLPLEFMSMMDCNKRNCYECGDSFLFNKSLQHHYDRRSIFVKVRCVQCSQMLVFFNKCEILRHAREHSEHGEVMQFNGANLLPMPIPIALCRRRTKEKFLAVALDEDHSIDRSNAKKTSACAMACTECSYVTDGKETLEDHFLNRTFDVMKSCDICKLPLHNKCVYSAHMRMHRHAPPHTCPECGQTFDCNQMEFNLHLRIQCFHLSRSTCFKCRLCNLTFLTDDQLRYHLRQNHVQKYYKCRECPMAFKTTQNIANHQRCYELVESIYATCAKAHIAVLRRCESLATCVDSTDPKCEPSILWQKIDRCVCHTAVWTVLWGDTKHTNKLTFMYSHNQGNRSAHNLTPEPANRLKTIYKCPLCESVFTDSSHSQQLFVLHKHFDSHIDSARITAFKCYLCTRLFEQKAPLREHLQQEHDFAALNEASDTADMVTEDVQSKQIHQAIITEEDQLTNEILEDSSKLTVDGNQDSALLTRQTRLARKRSAEEPVSKKPPKSRKPFKLRIKGMQSGTLSARRASIPSTASSSPASSDGSPPPLKPVPIPKMRVVTNHKGKKTYPCPECEKIFLSSHSRSSHVRSIHRGIRSLYCCTHCPVLTVKFAKRITLVKHLNRVHGIKNVQQDDIKIIRTQVPLVAPGEKFRAALIKVDKNGTVTPEKHVPEKKLPRKKITSGNARARRLAVQAGKRLRSLKEGLTHSDSEESYGEVDEKTVEEGWEVEDPAPKTETEDEVEVDASFFNFPDIYTCIKCDFQHTDRLTFQDHIIEHSQAMEPSEISSVSAALTMVQCTECGISFASSASLDKHMHIRHKIKRRTLLERYDNKLRAERLKLEASGSALSPGSAAGTGSVGNIRRCKVCFRKFDSDSELKTHMRTHGLAFVKSKQH